MQAGVYLKYEDRQICRMRLKMIMRRIDSNQPLEKEALPFIEGLAARPIDGLELLVV